MDETLQRIVNSIEFPKKPKMGKWYQWILLVVYLCLIFGALFFIMTFEDIAVKFFAGILLIFAIGGFAAECHGVFIVFLHQKKDYELAQTNFPKYRHKMAMQLCKEMNIQKEYSEDLEKTYGKKKKRRLFVGVFGMGSSPDGHIRP